MQKQTAGSKQPVTYRKIQFEKSNQSKKQEDAECASPISCFPFRHPAVRRIRFHPINNVSEP
jgi:hypothetical protein